MSVFDASEVFNFAIRIEENGEKFYRLMSEKFKGGNLRDTFNFLADEEVKHKEIFAGFLKNRELYEPAESFTGEYLEYLRSYADGHIFTKENAAYLASGKIDSEKHALQFAQDREIDSILYYLEAKNLVRDSQKQAIDKIVEEERRHYLKLLQIKKTLT
ncbi:MAG: ferritin family protein [Candidatus Omnitrophica bacterium]|nr:ferritin family protein [Candidatus Omnitrophota bacterium]MDD5236566.1 ferritin family protein [Candidatus Omnitrophota bacterium]MDD5610207.1 ferritin family protein [Candidatus Omnitrophota bacterium]